MRYKKNGPRLQFSGRLESPGQRALRIVRRAARSAVLGLALVVGTAAVAEAQSSSSSSFLTAIRQVSAPAGFNGVCARLSWACAARASATSLTDRQILKLAADVNTTMNRRYPEIADDRQYNRAEYWALPTARGGDCEDFALVKKQALLAKGVSTDKLMIATVLDRQQRAHAVLVLRTSAGDLVLDNLTNRILPWHETGYSFLRMQDPNAPSRWNAVMAGGMFAAVLNG